ncbi:MAG: glucose-phosphate cytidylyltransferase [Devosia sp.]|uniref:glucose-1-phosphate cytidylyltransferase n=1 Tax=Devosia sp. TaxID=1871048 RepID=UPI00261951C8|nr:glucose-1-phosphate cytidylyltransferase [Devosia sp.]MDB5526947.1 glucose-phosphate cytidylyltransferase [Devosia sp.]
MKVVILAGGYGTRIRDVQDDIPKPMIPIGPYPILFHIMRHYARFGHKEFVVCLGYKGQVIKDFFLGLEAHTRDMTISFGNGGGIEFHGDHFESDWKITLADTGLKTMTGGRISRIRKYVGDEEFMLTYGDGVSDIDLDKLLAFHRAHGKVLTVTGVRPPARFGEMVGNEDGTIAAFNEKPQATGGRISGGFFVAGPRLFDYVSDDVDLVFEQQPIREVVAAGELVMYPHDGFWQPMDTSREYQLLNGLYDAGNAPWLQ